MNPSRRVIVIVIPMLVCCIAPASAQVTTTYEVSQWEPVSMTFVTLGIINPYETAGPVSAYYNFTGGNPSFTDPAPTLVSDRAHLFLVDSGVDGLCLGYVLDRQGDGSGGEGETCIMVSGDPDGLSWLVQDGPPGGGNPDQYSSALGGAVFTACQTWPGANSDGAILGSLNGAWSVEVVFTDVCGGFATTQGLTSWVAASCDGFEVALVLAPDLPVRLRPVSGASLAADVPGISVSAGGVQTLTLDAGPAAAGAPYLLLGSLSGTAPGVPLVCIRLPLVHDAWCAYTLDQPNTFPLTGSLGTLDAAGQATASFSLPPGLALGAQGLVFHHAYLCVVPGLLTSNAVSLTLQP